jgi:hypothetical protein
MTIPLSYRQRRLKNVLVWIVVSTAVGCLIAGLTGGDPAGQSLWLGVLDATRHDGVFILAVAVQGTVSGAIMGDLPGLRRAWVPAQVAWAEQQRRRRPFSMPAPRSLGLAAGWLLLCVALELQWPVPSGLWIVLTLLGVVRTLHLGRYLCFRRNYMQSGQAG